MKLYITSALAGLRVGIVYALLNVRSPAPPVAALVGLLGILLGEQVVPIVKRLFAGERITSAWVQQACAPHVLGELPGRGAGGAAPPPRG
jgi:XapX domain-containing protein